MSEPRDAGLAREIALANGLWPEDITSLAGRGTVNHVFGVRAGETHVVIRFAIDPLRVNEFQVEAWALDRAGAEGIPSPRVVAVGILRGVPYLVESFVEGAAGTRVQSLELWRTLGEYGRRVHAIAITDDAPDRLFSRFGRGLGQAWQAHLEYNLGQLADDDPLIALEVYPPELSGRLRSALSPLQDVDFRLGLSHGDLSPRNLVVPRSGDPVLLDWGSASAGPMPYGDLLPLLESHQTTNDPTAPELQAFAAGYSVSLEGIADTLDRLLLLGALDLVRWAIDRRPDLLPAVVASARARIGSSPLLVLNDPSSRQPAPAAAGQACNDVRSPAGVRPLNSPTS